ncbi:MAG: hypothetical protein CL893_03220 [Dehalococcoidia bacterium]|nr:hypothetical protein [Dehalococcoidia bacterium]|tara:strand:+ start:684 stop:1199 length:516 start_codon:yes stop_codon:yes gene_type:complete
MNEFKRAIISGLEEYLMLLNKSISDLSLSELRWQPSLESNSIIYLLWHMGRVEDNWINQVIGGKESVWMRNGWNKKFPFDEKDYGKGYGKQDLANLPHMDKDQLMNFYHEQRIESLKIIESLSEEDLAKKYKRLSGELKTGYWILGHVLVEESQHLGQVAYIRGMIKGINN